MENIKYGMPGNDFAEVRFGDKRLDNRLKKSLDAMTQNPQESILSGCGTKHDAKAFYALLSNDKFSSDKITKAAKKATKERIQSSGLTEILLPQDTTDVNLSGHKKTEGLGFCGNNNVKGLQVHSCIALTPDGVPLGLVSQKYSTRETSKINLTSYQKQRRPIEEKESYRWLETVREALDVVPEGVNPIILCDREGDFYEMFSELLSLKVAFVVRIAHDRNTFNSGSTTIQQIRRTGACGEVEISIPRDTRKNRPARCAKMEVAYCAVSIVKPKHVKSESGSLTFTLVRITEIGDTADEPIEWMLATNMSVTGADDAMKTVEYYVQRWKIERFHYILKSGCQVEKIQQRTYERILPLIFIYSVISVFVLALTYFARYYPDISCDAFFDNSEWKLLHRLVTKNKAVLKQPYSIKTAVEYLGQLGSYKHSPGDGDYGVKSIWKGLVKFFDAIDLVDRLMG
jgi:hypothetical protein